MTPVRRTRSKGKELDGYAGVAAQAAAVRSGSVSAVDLLDGTLARIEAAQPALNAFRLVIADEARAAARRVDQVVAAGRTGELGPLAGVPVAVKDNAAVAGHPALLGTGSQEPVAADDDEFVRKLRGAGAIIVGLTQMPELALWAATESRWQGVTRNPWDLDRAPGGSSGGSGAAVAAGLVAAAHATDGLGSIRIPASACGLVGLKPTHGWLPSTGTDEDHWLGMSHSGFLTRTVADTAWCIDAMLPEAGLTGALAGELPSLRIAVSAKPSSPVKVDPEIRAGLDRTARILSDLGHQISRRDPVWGNSLGVANTARYLAGMSIERARLANPHAVEPRTREMAAIGGLIPNSARRWARKTGKAFGARMAGFFAAHDVLLTPTMPVLPVRAGELNRRSLPATIALMLPCAAFTGPWNGCGFPAMSVPAAVTPGGLPIGMQLIGPPGSEARLLQLAGALEQACGWAARRPVTVPAEG